MQLPPPTTVRLPASWQDLFGSFRGCVCFRRKFHRPSNIGAGDRLAIVFDGVGGAGTVTLNGRSLGSIESGAVTARFDVTGLLRSNNELQVDLEFAGPAADASSGRLIRPVALGGREIQAAREVRRPGEVIKLRPPLPALQSGALRQFSRSSPRTFTSNLRPL